MRISKVENKLSKVKKISAIVSAAATAGVVITTILKKAKRKKGFFSFIRS